MVVKNFFSHSKDVHLILCIRKIFTNFCLFNIETFYENTLNLGGVTLHAFAGIGSGEASLKRCYDLASRAASSQIWRKCKILIIDEISMVDGEYFEVNSNKIST